jgi:hypothetical protein
MAYAAQLSTALGQKRQQLADATIEPEADLEAVQSLRCSYQELMSLEEKVFQLRNKRHCWSSSWWDEAAESPPPLVTRPLSPPHAADNAAPPAPPRAPARLPSTLSHEEWEAVVQHTEAHLVAMLERLNLLQSTLDSELAVVRALDPARDAFKNAAMSLYKRQSCRALLSSFFYFR